MDIHKPKAAHSWREFLIEIGTIICGILIALGLEQGVETLHWREKVEHGRVREREELKQLYFQARERVQLEQCLDKRLGQLTEALMTGEGDWTPPQPVRHPQMGEFVYFAPFRSFSDETWRSLVADGTANHFGEHESSVYIGVYSGAAFMRDQNNRESADVDTLRILGRPTVLTREERHQYASLAERLRGANHRMAVLGIIMTRQIKRIIKIEDHEANDWTNNHSWMFRACPLLGLGDPSKVSA